MGVLEHENSVLSQSFLSKQIINKQAINRLSGAFLTKTQHLNILHHLTVIYCWLDLTNMNNAEAMKCVNQQAHWFIIWF